MPSRGRARANIRKTKARRRKINGRCINFLRREIPAPEACLVVGNNMFPDRIPREEREKYRYMIMGRISSSRNAHGVAKVINKVPKVVTVYSGPQGSINAKLKKLLQFFLLNIRGINVNLDRVNFYEKKFFFFFVFFLFIKVALYQTQPKR